MIYPSTPTSDHTETHFGVEIKDPFRWLEKDARKDADVARWVEAQNSLTHAHLATLPGREVFRQRLTQLLNWEQFTSPIKRGKRYFFTKSSAQENQPKLCLREGIEGDDRVLIDPHGWSKDGADALGEWSVSEEGAWIAYGVQTGGTDWRTIRVLNVETGQVLEDELKWVRFNAISWTKDSIGFFYSRFPRPEDSSAAMSGIAHHGVYFHALGTTQEQDRLIYSRPGALNLCDRTDDGRYLIIYSTPGAGVNALAAVDLFREEWKPRVLIDGFDAEWSMIGSRDTVLYLLTSNDAERRRIVSLNLAQTQPDPVEIVAQSDAVLTSAAMLGGMLLGTYLVDAITEVRRFQPDGKPDGLLALPEIGSAGGFRGHVTDNEAFFVHTSYHLPITVYRYDIFRNEYTVWAKPNVSVDVGSIVVKQLFYASPDGTKVPMFIVHRRDLTGPSPTLLYGYGGFGISQVPVFNPAQLAWVEQGGAMAVANIRGGGEYGRDWHMAGQFEKKQNVFDDFIAAGEFLKAEGITTAGGLAIHGESNGGLLVGAVVNQRPDLFAAALPHVGVMDMLRFHKFTGGVMGMSDYGDPEEERHFKNLLDYSPYHNIKSSAPYPAILVTTADADDRVVPGHSFKYVAALQADNLGPKPRLIRVETRAGHGAGMPLDKMTALYADMWAFAAHWTGLEVTPIA